MIVSAFFNERAEFLIGKIVDPELNILDFWHRFEWQHRGSTHVHGFLWQGAPNVDEISVDDADAVHLLLIISMV
jgi:hypothetical protein